MTFIVSSYFIEVIGNEDVDLEMPTNFFVFLGKVWKKSVKSFSRA
jgi:hypothetical protein